MKQMIVILVSVMLVDNFVLSKFLGICPFLGVSKKMDSAVGMGLAVMAVMTISSLVTQPIYQHILYPNFTFLRTLVFIIVIATLVQLIEILLKRFVPSLYQSLGVYLPLMTTNCAVLGVALLNVESSYGLEYSFVNGLGGGVGYLLAMVLFAGVRSRMESCVVTKSFQGVPITLIAASIVSIAFMGFGGMVEGMFGL